jgi:hypothetical protein
VDIEIEWDTDRIIGRDNAYRSYPRLNITWRLLSHIPKRRSCVVRNSIANRWPPQTLHPRSVEWKTNECTIFARGLNRRLVYK